MTHHESQSEVQQSPLQSRRLLHQQTVRHHLNWLVLRFSAGGEDNFNSLFFLFQVEQVAKVKSDN
jgi:hypothetical protein